MCVASGAASPIVFEVQLSYTFLSTVIERDEFYRREGEFIIWVFQSFNRQRAAVADEAFFNRRNLFVLDAEAMLSTEASGLLTFAGWHQQPRLVHGRIEDVWQSRPVGLRDVHFLAETLRPVFYDYAAQLARVQEQARAERQQQEEKRWDLQREGYIDAALRSYLSHDSDEQQERQEVLLDIVREMRDMPQWRRDFQVLADPVFYGWHGILAVLLSMRLGRPVSYSVPTVFQVLEAGVRTSGDGFERPYTVLFLRAYKVWRPEIKPKQRIWVRGLAGAVKASLDAGQSLYQRNVAYDEAIGMLFPELQRALSDEFGRGVAPPGQAQRIAARIELALSRRDAWHDEDEER